MRNCFSFIRKAGYSLWTRKRTFYQIIYCTYTNKNIYVYYIWMHFDFFFFFYNLFYSLQASVQDERTLNTYTRRYSWLLLIMSCHKFAVILSQLPTQSTRTYVIAYPPYVPFFTFQIGFFPPYDSNVRR